MKLACCLYNRIQRNSASEVPYSHLIVGYCYVDDFSVTHRELVDGVVYHLFKQGIDTVIRFFSVSELSYVHSGPFAYGFKTLEFSDFVVSIIYRFTCHNLCIISCKDTNNRER